MRFMIIRKADQDTEAGVMPSEQLLADMMKYNEEMVKAGVMLAGEGLHPSAKGARVKFSNGKPTIVDGPFTETKELVSGYWVLEVSSREEAVEWIRKAPLRGGEVEVRPFSTAEDFGEAFTPELQEKESQLRGTAQRGA